MLFEFLVDLLGTVRLLLCLLAPFLARLPSSIFDADRAIAAAVSASLLRAGFAPPALDAVDAALVATASASPSRRAPVEAVGGGLTPAAGTAVLARPAAVGLIVADRTGRSGATYALAGAEELRLGEPVPREGVSAVRK